MKLKRLEIVGFKSFRDRTVFDFTGGINAIVGPNGSGKSNVIDAIRWAMGEQRVKSLRGRKMDDVIFGGSDNLAGTGMAEVTLLLDNHNGVFPAPYTDRQEVSITRRLFRDMESDYFINKAPCRLLDIREFFMGTGMGGRAYSIIEQNSINSLIEARPEEIRHFIEEVAGISKYRSRKEAALRKMEAAQANIARVRDIMRELKNQLQSLSRQAKRAQVFKETREALKNAQLSLSLQQWHELEALSKEATLKRQRVSNVLVDLVSSQEALEAKITFLKVSLLEAREALADAQRYLYEIKNQISIKEQKIVFNEQKVAELLARSTTYTGEVALLEQKVVEAGKALVTNEEETTRLKGSFLQTQKELDTLQERHAQLQSKETELYAAIEQIKTEYIEIVTAKTNHRNTAVGIVRMLEDLEKKQKLNEGDTGEVKAQIEQVQSAQQEAAGRFALLSSQREKLQARLQNISEERMRLRGENVIFTEELENLRVELSQKSSRCKSLLEFQSGYSWCPSGAQALLVSKDANLPFILRKSVVGTISEHIEVEDGFENAVEAILGERMRSVLVATWEAAIDAAAYIRSSSLERSSVIPLGVVVSQTSGRDVPGARKVLDFVKYDSSYADLVRWLLRNSYIVDNLSQGVRFWQECGGGNFVTMEGDLLNEQGTIIGGARGREEASLLKNKRELSLLEREKVETEIVLAETEARKRQTTTLLEQFEEEEGDLRKQIHSLALEAADAAKDAEHHDGAVKQLQRRLEVLVFESQTFSEEIVSLRERLRLARIEEERSVQRELHIKEELAIEQERWQVSKGELAVLQESLTLQKVALAQMQADLRVKEEATITIKALHDDARRRIAELQAMLANNEANVAAIVKESETERSDISLLWENCVQKEAAFNHHRQENITKEQELTSLEGELRELLKKKENAQEELNGVQRELNNIVYQQEALLRGLAEKGHENIAESIAQFEMLTEQEIGALRELAEKKHRAVENFGEVNLLALGEYEQVRERYDFLVTQEDDINTAIDTLQRTVTRINDTSRRRFAAAFEGISGHFQNILPRLFTGGLGYLRLTNEENLLETGVDIEVQTPKKKLQSLSLLSGGEKTLAAIALIFAMVFYRPSSFLLFDEIDAALDDSNVVLYNNILKEIAGLTQVLLVTHNRASMEFADSLYGITLQPDGTSTSISVSLNKGQ